MSLPYVVGVDPRAIKLGEDSFDERFAVGVVVIVVQREEGLGRGEIFGEVYDMLPVVVLFRIKVRVFDYSNEWKTRIRYVEPICT